MTDPDIMYRGELMILLRMPGDTTQRMIKMFIDDSILRCALPRPRTREVAWDYMAHQADKEMMEERRMLAECLANKIMAGIMDLFAQKDTTNGYTPEEWERLVGPRKLPLP